MGLSSFNAMRAREKEKAEADSKKSTPAIEIREVEAPVETSEVKTEETSEAKVEEPAKDEKPVYNFQKKKTDAEKLKKKE